MRSSEPAPPRRSRTALTAVLLVVLALVVLAVLLTGFLPPQHGGGHGPVTGG